MLHELMKLLLFEPVLLNVLGFLIGLSHEVVGLVDGRFRLLDGSDLLMDGCGQVLVEFLLFGLVLADYQGQFLWVGV